MKLTQKIQLDIYSDKAEQFYLSLLKYKLSGKKDLELLSEVVDAIHFDEQSLMKSFELSEAQQKKINDKLFEIHTYLLKSKKDSADYFMVSKENFEKFQASPFGKELHGLFQLMEISREWIGKEESAEVKATAALFSWFIGALVQGLTGAIERGMSGALNAAVALKDTKPFNVKPNKKGNLVCKTEGETIELELFAEKTGQIRKVTAPDLENLPEDSILYLKIEERAVKIKIIGDHIEVTQYNKAKVKNQKLDLSKSTITEKISMPKEFYEKGIEYKEDGSINYTPVPEPKDDLAESAEVSVKPNKPIVYNYVELLKEQGEDVSQYEKSNIPPSASVFSMLDENFTSFLKLPKNTPEKVQARDRIIVNIYELLKKQYPKITSHASTTITGYIASRMELLDTEQQHDETDRKQPYRKYLRDSAYNILKSHSII